MIIIFRRIVKQIHNDKRTLGLLIFAPVFVFTLLYFILGTEDYTPVIAVNPSISNTIISSLEENNTIVTDSADQAEKNLIDETYDAFIYQEGSVIHIKVLESNNITKITLKNIQESFLSLQKNGLSLETSYIFETNKDNQFDSLSYVFLGVISFFFVFILSGMSFVRERFSQTLERMLITPVKAFQVIGGYTLGFGFFSAIQCIVIILYSIYLLKLAILGNIFLCMFIMILLSFCAVSMGALVSLFSKNELQIVQFIPIIIIPQIFFSGLIPLDTIPLHLGNIAYITPIYYGCSALKEIIMYGESFVHILPLLSGLTVYIIILFTINTFALKFKFKYFS